MYYYTAEWQLYRTECIMQLTRGCSRATVVTADSKWHQMIWWGYKYSYKHRYKYSFKIRYKYDNTNTLIQIQTQIRFTFKLYLSNLMRQVIYLFLFLEWRFKIVLISFTSRCTVIRTFWAIFPTPPKSYATIFFGVHRTLLRSN